MLILVGASGAHGAEVYRSTDANGTVRYSDRPLDQSSKPVFVAVAPRSSRPVAATTAPARPATAADAKEDAAKQVDPNRGVQAEGAPDAETKAKNCQVAKQRQQSYSEAHRLFKTDANGQRVYLSDSEIDTARARAEADVHTWCG